MLPPLVWLVSLSEVYKPGLINNLSDFIARLPSRSQLQQERIDGEHLV